MILFQNKYIQSLSFILLMIFHSITFGKTIDISKPPYLANGSDLNDDTHAIKNAIYDLIDGDTLYFPSGIYLIGDTLDIDKNNIVVLFKKDSVDSAILKATTDTTIIQAISQNNIKFVNLQLDGDKIIRRGIYLWGCNSVSFIANIIENINGNNDSRGASGIYISACENVNIVKCIIRNIFNTTVPTYISLSSLEPDRKSAEGIFIEAKTSRHILIDNCYFNDIRAYWDSDGIKFNNYPKSGNSVDGIIKNCSFINCYKRAIKLQCGGITIQNNYIKNIRTSNEIGGALISIQCADYKPNVFTENIKIIDNEIIFNTKNTDAIDMWKCKNIDIINNTIKFIGPKDIFPDQYISGIRTEGSHLSDNITIKNVQIHSTKDTPSSDLIAIHLDNAGNGNGWLLENIQAPKHLIKIGENYSNIKLKGCLFSIIDDRSNSISIEN